jgi:F-box-like
MSISSTSELNELEKKGLEMVFEYLDVQDLENCEAVCHQWRDVLLTGKTWGTLYDRNIKNLTSWRRVQETNKKLVENSRTLQTEQKRILCKQILRGARINRPHFEISNFRYRCVYDE